MKGRKRRRQESRNGGGERVMQPRRALRCGVGRALSFRIASTSSWNDKLLQANVETKVHSSTRACDISTRAGKMVRPTCAHSLTRSRVRGVPDAPALAFPAESSATSSPPFSNSTRTPSHYDCEASFL